MTSTARTPEDQVAGGREVVADTAGTDLPAHQTVANASRRSWRRPGLWYLATVFFLVTLNFLLPRALPVDPIEALEAQSGQAPRTSVRDKETREALAHYYGFDRPLHAQYLSYLGGLVRGDLGVSIRYHVPVRRLLAERLPWTMLLAAASLTVAAVIGLVTGVHSGWRRGRPADQGLLALFTGINSLPPFLVATAALFVLGVKLGWFPLGGARTHFSGSDSWPRQVADIAHHLVLPASVLATQFTVWLYLVMRAGMVSELGSDYLLVGRAKGLVERRLKYRYAARNALAPVVTALALHVGVAVTANIFVERVFAYPGLGRLMFEAVQSRDYPTAQGCFVLITVIVLSANFLADVINARLDPRTKE